MPIYGDSHLKVFSQRLKEFQRDNKASSALDDESSARVASYFCVRANGGFEAYFRASFLDMVRKQASQRVVNLVSRQCDSWYNLKRERVQAIVDQVMPERRKQLVEFYKSNGEFVDGIGTIVGNKNSLGHSNAVPMSWGKLDQALTGVRGGLNDFHDAVFSY